MPKLIAAAALVFILSAPSFTAQASNAATQPAAPFSYQTGVTTLADAKKQWTLGGAKIRLSGRLNINTKNSPLAKEPDPNRKIEMFTVFGVNVDGATAANFYFYDGTLFRIEAPLKVSLPLSMSLPFNIMMVSFHHYSDEQVDDLDAALRKKYGAPSEVKQWIDARRTFERDVPIWKRSGNTIILAKGEGVLLYENDKDKADAEAYYKNLCKVADPKLNPNCQAALRSP